MTCPGNNQGKRLPTCDSRPETWTVFKAVICKAMTTVLATHTGSNPRFSEPDGSLRQRRKSGDQRATVRRLLQMLLAGVSLGLFLCWLGEESSPSKRFQQGLRCVRANKAEGVQYNLLSLTRRPEFEEQAGLLQGWLRLEEVTPGNSMAVKDAMTELDLAVGTTQHRALALALIGKALYRDGRFHDALATLAKALEADPDEVEAHRWLGVAFYDIGNMASALPHLERVAASEPNNGRPHRLMGIIYRDLPDFDRAAAAYEESLARDPRQPDVDEIRLELGRCQFVRRSYDEALATLRSCPDTAEVLTLRAQCYHAKGLTEQAQYCVDQALADDAAYADALGMAATLATDAGKHSEAAEWLARAVELRPSEYSLRYRLVQAYRRIGEFDLANQQAHGMDELQKLHEDLDTLVREANFDRGNAQIRYGIAALAERLDMPKMAASWRKAAEMLDAAAHR